MMSKSRPTPTSWHLISPIFPKKYILATASRGLNNISQYPWDASNVKNMNITRRLAEDDWYVKNTAEKTQTVWRKSAQTKRNVQTDKKTVWLTQDHVTFIKNKNKRNIRNKTREEYNFPGSKENVGSSVGENTYGGVDPINQDNKYRALVEKLIQLKPND